jgi:hypothetical protein
MVYKVILQRASKIISVSIFGHSVSNAETRSSSPSLNSFLLLHSPNRLHSRCTQLDYNTIVFVILHYITVGTIVVVVVVVVVVFLDRLPRKPRFMYSQMK